MVSSLLLMHWSTTAYSLENIDYSSAFGNEILGEGTTTTAFDVMDYGAAGNGQTDDSQAFNKAWKDVCGASTNQEVATLQVPPGKTFLLGPVAFQGPCMANTIHFQLQGTLIAPQSTSWAGDALDTWIQFSGIHNLIFDGDGKIDGQGSFWWQSCKKKTIFGTFWSCQHRPRALHFHNCNGLRLEGLTHLNSPRSHISINACQDVSISNLNIIAPEDSPNTDGIDISASSNVNIQDSRIGTGDDCVAINGGSSFINITGVDCGPGHGISIGSLGDGAYDTVQDVHVKNCNLKNTQNGVRIKTFQDASGFATNISFEHIGFDNVRNPIIIDQFYQDKSKNSKEILKAAVIEVSHVTYSDIHGTSASDRAIDLSCDDVVGCSNIVMHNINITSAVPGQNVYGFCNNTRGTATSIQPEVSCLF
ncbi:probable polygalacturonase At3g15720 [Durio zibethinus]|uniref:Probable polygalacturonase At3g15720 n=1 Tax=Durio zibethinus TaxID=66656 RepID=A0A6P5X1M3_DURZI|nr:probable polygalacturonase At3g15720 [Durio zibethinus]